jgi:hypothetical protein
LLLNSSSGYSRKRGANREVGIEGEIRRTVQFVPAQIFPDFREAQSGTNSPDRLKE